MAVYDNTGGKLFVVLGFWLRSLISDLRSLILRFRALPFALGPLLFARTCKRFPKMIVYGSKLEDILLQSVSARVTRAAFD